MCRKKLTGGEKSSLRSKLVMSIVPLFLIGEFLVIAIIFGNFIFSYQSLTSQTSKNPSGELFFTFPTGEKPFFYNCENHYFDIFAKFITILCDYSL